MIKKFILPTLFLFLFAPWILPTRADRFDPLPTQFPYSTERLSSCRSPCLITPERLDKWEAPLQHYFAEKSTRFSSQVRIYTYVYLAQRDAAFLSYNTHRCFIGSLDPLTKEIVLLFFPDFTNFPQEITDPYSEALAKAIVPYYQRRLEAEREKTPTFKIAQLTPWEESLPQPPPPSLDLQGQVAAMKKERADLTEEQRALASAWSEDELDWRELANAYMERHSTPLGKRLQVRALLMMAIYDGLIASYKAKEAYSVPRPFVLDESIDPLVHNPGSPSYPSTHATQAGAADVILSHFFPCAGWEKRAAESAQSRVWAGVHTPQDVLEGRKLGEQIGHNTLERGYRHEQIF